MTEPIHIIVPYRGKEKEIEIQLEVTGYTHRIRAIVDEVPVIFEPDEEKQYRAVVPFEYVEAGRKLDPVLLQEIADTISAALG